MADLEETVIYDKQQNPFLNNIALYHRYIDDNFILYKDGYSINQFCKWMNGVDINLKISWQSDHDSTAYLDICIFRTSNNALVVSPYKKGTDHNSYLHYSSFYSTQLKQNISFSQLLRIKRNSMFHKDFLKESQGVVKDFQMREYPSDMY